MGNMPTPALQPWSPEPTMPAAAALGRILNGGVGTRWRCFDFGDNGGPVFSAKKSKRTARPA